MRRFEFKLEKVLELRRYYEREWELKLAESTSRVLSVEREIQDWGRRRIMTTSEAVPVGRIDMSSLRSREDFVNLVDERVEQLQSRLVALEAERDKVRQGYLEASRARKALTRLKERRAEEYYDEGQREETRTLDEIGGTIVIRRKKSEEKHV
jgi:flagellar FliJ protein